MAAAAASRASAGGGGGGVGGAALGGVRERALGGLARGAFEGECATGFLRVELGGGEGGGEGFDVGAFLRADVCVVGVVGDADPSATGSVVGGARGGFVRVTHELFRLEREGGDLVVASGERGARLGELDAEGQHVRAKALGFGDGRVARLLGSLALGRRAGGVLAERRARSLGRRERVSRVVLVIVEGTTRRGGCREGHPRAARAGARRSNDARAPLSSSIEGEFRSAGRRRRTHSTRWRYSRGFDVNDGS